MPRNCLDCSQEISGRSDKKFCSDYCRINYHNTLAKNKQRAFRKINKILLTNRNILSDFVNTNFPTISRMQLLNAGFKFEYHTHILYLENKKIICIYDYGITYVKPSLLKIKNLVNS
jgi:hypothetical protein